MICTNVLCPKQPLTIQKSRHNLTDKFNTLYMYTSLLGMVHYEIKCFPHHNYNRLLACHKTNYQCIQKLFLKRIISVFKTYYFFY